MKHLVAPSLLSADFAKLGEEVDMLNRSRADWLHLDVMDGCFVPNLSFGLPVIRAVRKHATKPLDVHLMIARPDDYIDDFRKAGADILTVHCEACTHLHRTVSAIREAGMKAGVAINPHTPVEALTEIINDTYMVCLMSVNPGFGGQSFIPSSLDKIKALRSLIKDKRAQALIEVDGGVTLDNAAAILQAGADVLVAGNTVFSASDPMDVISRLKAMNS